MEALRHNNNNDIWHKYIIFSQTAVFLFFALISMNKENIFPYFFEQIQLNFIHKCVVLIEYKN